MAYELIICEKNDASRRIAEALADKNPEKKIVNKIPYFELSHKGKKIIVASAVGHIFTVAENKKTQNYPNFDISWQPSFKVSKKTYYTKNYFDLLTQLSKDADSYVIGCDFDTEGEVIGRNVLWFICKKKNAKRMKFSTLTKEELFDSYENASKSIDVKLAEAGEARHFLDNYFGLNSSKALTSAIKNAGLFKILSSGRVQSPILTLIAKREEEIESFIPKPYWQLIARVNIKDGTLEALHKEEKFWNKDKADSTYKKCKNKDAIVREIKKRQYYTQPPTPFNITSLQTESYKNFGFSPKQTLDIAERLYLSAHISYPRTSSEKLPQTIDYKRIIKNLANIKEINKNALILLQKAQLKPNEGAKTDPAHISIYPTHDTPDLSKLSEQEKKIYMLLAKRFLSVFADPALRESIEIKFDINNEIFIAKGSRTISPGWISFYQPYVKFKEVQLPEVKENEKYNVKELILKEDKTKPPARYTQGSMISEMEERNLGTRATRANILQILYDRYYIEDKSIKITDIGKAVVKVLEKYVPELISEDLTRQFEQELEQIQESKTTEEEVLEKARELLKKIFINFKKHEKDIGKHLVEALKQTQEKTSILGKCSMCKEGELRILYSRKTKKRFVACNKYPACKTTYSLTTGKIIPTNEMCEYCKTPIVKVQRKGKRPFKMCLTYDCKSKEKWKSNSNGNNNNNKENNNQKA